MRLTALRPVLYHSHLYSAGEELPVNNAAMVDAWLEAGSAKWVDEATEQPGKAKPKAKQAAADPGIEGRSDSGNVEQGKIPKTPARAKSRGTKK